MKNPFETNIFLNWKEDIAEAACNVCAVALFSRRLEEGTTHRSAILRSMLSIGYRYHDSFHDEKLINEMVFHLERVENYLKICEEQENKLK
jgi:hypothetical protein